MNSPTGAPTSPAAPVGDYPPAGPQPRLVTVRMPHQRVVVTYILLAVTVLVFGLQYLSDTFLGGDILFYYGGKINDFILQGQVWRLITPVFLHGSIIHIGFNMFALYQLGRGLERFYGPWRFILIYFLGGFAGNVLSFLITPSPSLGSSTAIFGLLIAQAVFVYQNRRFFPNQVRPMLLNTLTIAIINLGIGLTPGSNIDNWGHLGGILGGGLFAWLGGPRWQVEPYPEPHIRDDRSTGQVEAAAFAVLAVFGTLTLAKFFIK